MPLEALPFPSLSPKHKPERLRAQQAKKLIIELLEKYPLIEAACSKVGISRSTHYEWYKNDVSYRTRVEQALETSLGTVNDIAESNIINGVKKGDFKSTLFWLLHRHPAYVTKNNWKDAKVQKLVLKPKPSPSTVTAIRKYNPDYKPPKEDVYITEEEWEEEKARNKRASNILSERGGIKRRLTLDT